jgi:hypothetical protein
MAASGGTPAPIDDAFLWQVFLGFNFSSDQVQSHSFSKAAWEHFARASKNSQLTCGDITIICETVH